MCILTNKIKHIFRLWKNQFINITKIAQSESTNILKFDISVIIHKLQLGGVEDKPYQT